MRPAVPQPVPAPRSSVSAIQPVTSSATAAGTLTKYAHEETVSLELYSFTDQHIFTISFSLLCVLLKLVGTTVTLGKALVFVIQPW